MSINLTNRNDIACDSLTIINNNGRMNVGTSITNLNNTVNSVTGIPIETLNSIQKIGEAIDNDPQFFTNINNKIDNKQNTLLIADASVLPANTSQLFDVNNTRFRAINVSAPLSITTPNYEYVSINCDSYDKANIDDKLTTINTNINAKQATLVAGGAAVSGLQQAILSGSTIKNILAGTGISLASGSNNITITGIDAYTKSAVDTKFSDLIGSAPVVLNTLQEIASLIGDSSTVTTTLINAIASKANLSETFLKSSIDSDVYLTIDNKRLVSLGALNNKLIFEICDTIGSVPSDGYYSALSLEMNTSTKKITCTIPDILIVNGKNILTELSNKLNSSDLSSYVLTSTLTSTLSSYLKLNVNNGLLVPSIILTSTTTSAPITGARSTGSRLVLYDLQSTNINKVDYALGVEPHNMWFSIDGTNIELTGGYKFYVGVNCIATIKANGNFDCQAITCSGLTIGTTNILTELNNKLSSSSTQSITSNIITAKSLIISDTKAYSSNTQSSQVSATVSNNGTSGVASLFVKTQNSSNIDDEVLKIHVGKNMGGQIETTSQSRLKFSTYTGDSVATNNRPSLEIDSYGSRDVIVVAPLIVQSNLSTFERNIFVGTLEAVNVNNITTVGGIQVGNKLRVNGLIETRQLRSIDATATDGVTIFNIENNMVAKFYNDYHTDLNGPTNMLGDVYCSHKIDCYRFTATEIIPRNSLNNLSFKNFGNATAIEINDTAVEIKQPLKVQSTTDSVFNYGASFGILQPASTRGIHCYSSASIGGNLTVDGFLAAKPYISIKVSTSVYSSGVILAVPSTSSVIGTPGAVTQINQGYQSATITRGTVANTNYFLYTFTFPAHPLGSLFAVGCTFLTGGTSNPTPNAIFTATNTSTTITVWIRETSTNILRDGNFYVYSIP